MAEDENVIPDDIVGPLPFASIGEAISVFTENKPEKYDYTVSFIIGLGIAQEAIDTWKRGNIKDQYPTLGIRMIHVNMTDDRKYEVTVVGLDASPRPFVQIPEVVGEILMIIKSDSSVKDWVIVTSMSHLPFYLVRPLETRWQHVRTDLVHMDPRLSNTCVCVNFETREGANIPPWVMEIIRQYQIWGSFIQLILA